MSIIALERSLIITMEYQIEHVISELAKIDNAAESIITSADVDKSNYASEIDKKTIEFDKQLEDNVKKSLDEFKGKLQSDNDRVLKQMRANTEIDLKKLEEAYNLNHTKMAQSIFADLIKE